MYISYKHHTLSDTFCQPFRSPEGNGRLAGRQEAPPAR